jgi:hypothetical protein
MFPPSSPTANARVASRALRARQCGAKLGRTLSTICPLAHCLRWSRLRLVLGGKDSLGIEHDWIE